LNGTNDAEMFAESFEAVAHVGSAGTIAIDMDLVPNGSSSAAKSLSVSTTVSDDTGDTGGE
jgi:hypothetical protein